MNKLKLTICGITGLLAFLSAYFLNMSMDSMIQYLIIVSLVFIDGFYGIIAGVKNEGFETRKALRIIKSLTYYSGALTVMLLIEMLTPAANWISETFIIPFITFELISIAKNAARAGYLTNQKILKILSKIDQHKA
jgi:phage-related holin